MSQFQRTTSAASASGGRKRGVRKKLAIECISLGAETFLPVFCVARRSRITEDTYRSSRLEYKQNCLSKSKDLLGTLH